MKKGSHLTPEQLYKRVHETCAKIWESKKRNGTNTSWNKGKKGVYSDVTLEQMSKSRSEYIKNTGWEPKNKGKKGLHKHSDETRLEIKAKRKSFFDNGGKIWNKNIPQSEAAKQKMRENHYDCSFEKNPRWKGDKVGYCALHGWVRKLKPKPLFCECCKKKPPHDLANISQEYKRDINDFEWLCCSCHHIKDNKFRKDRNEYFLKNS